MANRNAWGGVQSFIFRAGFVLALCGCGAALAQAPRRRGPQRRPPTRNSGKTEEKKEEDPPPLPNDKRLLSLHRQFVTEAEKLALEYEEDEQWDRAKAVYQEIVKLVPRHAAAKNKLQLLRARESNAVVEQFKVQADKDWQDTYIDVVKGRPVRIRSIGSWTFNLSIRVGPEGIKIPEELKEYNMGCLIGVVRAPGDKEFSPFVIGRETQFVADRDGRLFLRMYDVSPQDNEGELDVEVRGTFKSTRRD